MLAICGYCVAIFAALTASALSNNLSHARAALTMPLYWPLASLAALRALFELAVPPAPLVEDRARRFAARSLLDRTAGRTAEACEPRSA